MNIKNKLRITDILITDNTVIFKHPKTKIWHFETTIKNQTEIELILKLINERNRKK